jgi:prepilin-type N-terminal cleavage/methylation domain-containing protein
MRRSRSRRAFTLVELLVVILVLLILLGLLLAALSAVRGSGRRAQCEKNLKEVGNAFRMFINQYQGRSAGTIQDAPSMTPPPANSTGGRWVDLAGNVDKPAMLGWDGYMGFVLDFYAEEMRKMWSCPETQSPYIGNWRALGRQEEYLYFRGKNSGTIMVNGVPKPASQMPIKLSTISINQMANPGKVVLSYDGGIGLTGANGIAVDVDRDVTDWDDGGYPGMVPTDWGYLWFATSLSPLEGPHQRTHNLLRADFSVGTLVEPPNPSDPTTLSDIMTVDWSSPLAPSQETRQFTRFPRLYF